MKKIILSLAILSLLSACGSDDKGNSAAGGAAPKAKAPDPKVECPVFDGIYVRPAKNGEEVPPQPVEIHTKIEDGYYFYSLGPDAEFKRADGEEKEVQLEGKLGKTSLSCDSESVVLFAQAEDEEGSLVEPTTVKYSKAGENQLKMETSGIEVTSLNGVYTKQ